MHLLEIEVQHWRGLSKAVGTLSPRLNAIFGPNESGKSRLFQALRFAMFESFKGASQHKVALQSRLSSEPPFVRVVFETAGHVYELKKQFLKGGYAELTGGGATLRNEDAENRVRQLIGTRGGGPREVAAEDLGIWPLLMIRQGFSNTAPGEVLTDDSRSQLQARLANEIGAAAISEQGARLLDMAKAEFDRFFTTTGQENTTLRDARTRVAQATESVARERDAYARQEQTSTRLAEARSDWESLQGRVAKAKVDLQAARGRAEAAQLAGSRLKNSRTQFQLTTTQEERARRDLKSLQDLDEQLARFVEQAERYAREMEGFKSKEEELELLAGTRRQEVETAQEHLNLAIAAQGHARKAHERMRLLEQRNNLAATIEKLQNNAGKLDEFLALKGRVASVSDTQLAKLREKDQAARDAEARLAGAAVRVTLTPEIGLTVDGSAVTAGKSITIDVVDDRRIHLQGVAAIDVQPSLGTLDDLRADSGQARKALQLALADVGVATLTEAVEANGRGKDITNEINTLKREATALSKRGLDELIRDAAELESQIDMLGEIQSAKTLDDAIDAAEQAGAGLDTARSNKSTNDAALGDLRVKLAAARSSHEAAVEQGDALKKQRAERASTEELDAAIAKAVTDREAAAIDLTAAQSAFDSAGGEQAADDVKRFERAADGLGKQLGERRTQVDNLQGSLTTLMAAGSYESLADADAELGEATTQLERLVKQASTAKRLYTVLTEERRKVVEQMTAPVISRIRPYLVDLFPGSKLVTGENLDFQGLLTGNMQESFEDLSGGAQEQLALVTRIGMAEVLAGDTRLPLILDDSLVNSDPDRLRLIHRVLDRASKSLQIILLSCHEVLYDELGADYQIRLEKTRR